MDQGNGNQKSHYGFSALEKDEVWERWARGETLKAIGRVFGKPSSSIRGQLSPYGGIRPAPQGSWLESCERPRSTPPSSSRTHQP